MLPVIIMEKQTEVGTRWWYLQGIDGKNRYKPRPVVAFDNVGLFLGGPIVNAVWRRTWDFVELVTSKMVADL